MSRVRVRGHLVSKLTIRLFLGLGFAEQVVENLRQGAASCHLADRVVGVGINVDDALDDGNESREM